MIGPQVVARTVLRTQDDELVALGAAAVQHQVFAQGEVGGNPP